MLWYSLEAPRRGASNEYPQPMFSSRNKKNIMWIPPLICSYVICAPCKDSNQPVHLHSLLSVFVVNCMKKFHILGHLNCA